MDLVKTKKKIATSHYGYRGYETKKEGSKWKLTLNGELINSFKTTKASCECVDIILSGKKPLEIVSNNPKETKKKLDNCLPKKEFVMPNDDMDIESSKRLAWQLAFDMKLGGIRVLVPTEQGCNLIIENYDKVQFEKNKDVFEKLNEENPLQFIKFEHNDNELVIDILCSNKLEAVA